MERKYLQIRMADLTIRIYYKYSYMEKQCEAWLDTEERKPDIEAAASDEAIAEEYHQFPQGSVTEAMCESICIYREIAKQLGRFSAFVMHGAVVELDGKAYVFAAKSGVGKTTHTKLWIEHFGGRASYINGDKPIMRRVDDRWIAYGTPWMGKENFGGVKSAPVQAVCFIERGEKNEIRQISDKEIVNRLFHQFYLPNVEEELFCFMDLADDVVRKIPFYVLRCDISEEAVTTAYEAMK